MKSWSHHFGFLAFFSILMSASKAISLPYEDCSSSFMGESMCGARLEIGYTNGHFIGLDESYGEAGLFVPLPFLDRCFSFLEARGYRFSDNLSGASLGIGFRCCGLDYDERVFGVNLFWDYRQGTFGEYFTRVGLGIEWLGPTWDFRLNGYIPTGSQSSKEKDFIYNPFTGKNNFPCEKTEYSTSGGFNLEFGAPIGRFCDITLYGALGPYYFDGSDAGSSFFGGYARLELYWKAFLSFQLRSSFDNANHSQTQGTIYLTLPFELLANWCCLCSEKYIGRTPFTKRVERIGTIFIDKKGCKSITVDPFFPESF